MQVYNGSSVPNRNHSRIIEQLKLELHYFYGKFITFNNCISQRLCFGVELGTIIFFICIVIVFELLSFLIRHMCVFDLFLCVFFSYYILWQNITRKVLHGPLQRVVESFDIYLILICIFFFLHCIIVLHVKYCPYTSTLINSFGTTRAYQLPKALFSDQKYFYFYSLFV